MKNTFKAGFKTFGRILLANVMSLITVVSLTFLASIVFTEDVGYIAYGIKEESETSETSSQGSSEKSSEDFEKLFTHYYSDGDDTEIRAKYTNEGYTLKDYTIRSDMSRTEQIIYLSVSALFCLATAAVLIYNFIWKMGNSDRNLVNFGRMKAKKYKGFTVGLFAVSPYLLISLILCIGKWSFSANFPIVLYKYLNSIFYAPIEFICGSSSQLVFGDLAVWHLLLLVALQLLIPIYCEAVYRLGFKDILLSDRLTYKKEK